MSKILIIDDDPTIRLLFRQALQRLGYEVSVAVNGEEGLNKAQQIHPALIICDWMMPVIDGLEVCRRVKTNPALATTFLILLTARGAVEDRVRGLDSGADDFLSKPIQISELQARVRAGLRLHQINVDLQHQKQMLETELAEAAAYVQSLLPPPMRGSVAVDACFIPSRQLGGDCFDYYWLDPDYLVMYLLDVSGHGLGAALPSITVLNLLRSHSLPDANFYQPQDVLRALNETFQMSSQNEKYFTIWYGVYNRVRRQLTYASAGHPPAVLISPTVGIHPQVKRLRTTGLPVGMLAEAVFTSDRQEIPPGSVLYIFSDGIYERNQIDQTVWELDTFVDFLGETEITANLEDIIQTIRQSNGGESFSDDVSLLKINFS